MTVNGCQDGGWYDYGPTDCARAVALDLFGLNRVMLHAAVRFDAKPAKPYGPIDSRGVLHDFLERVRLASRREFLILARVKAC